MLRRVWPAILLLAALPASALDYRSLGANALFYELPSTKGKPLYIVNAGTPVEMVMTSDNMVKVRDMQGTLAWIEKKQLSEKRTLLVRVDRAQVRLQPDDKAALLFEAERDVILDLLEAQPSGWVKVKHRDGQSGYVKAIQVWGL